MKISNSRQIFSNKTEKRNTSEANPNNTLQTRAWNEEEDTYLQLQ